MKRSSSSHEATRHQFDYFYEKIQKNEHVVRKKDMANRVKGEVSLFSLFERQITVTFCVVYILKEYRRPFLRVP